MVLQETPAIDHLQYANLACHRIDRALRQERRTQDAWAALQAEEERLGPVGGQMPDTWNDLHEVFQDDIYFLVISVNQAVRACSILAHLGYEMRSIGQAKSIAAWRNVAEHWDDPARGKHLHAQDRWSEVSDEVEPGLSYAGSDEVELISGVSIPELRADLLVARDAAGLVSEQAWDLKFLTAKQAAEMLNMTVGEFEAVARQLWSHDFGEDGGLRFHRDWIEARQHGLLMPPSWEQYFA